MRGEHCILSMILRKLPGSSPHARGTLRFDISQITNFGIIPACAGNTLKMIIMTCMIWDHPRMRGEHGIKEYLKHGHEGSSPHARGTHGSNLKTDYLPGIIPACAGNTSDLIKRWATIRDHPRMRGEHFVSCGDLPLAQGSSPHARGTPTCRALALLNGGIIPACAGNTEVSMKCWTVPRDHPRMRGEHGFGECGYLCDEGSSPHARGTRFPLCNLS